MPAALVWVVTQIEWVMGLMVLTGTRVKMGPSGQLVLR
jgi:hypothetical protein